MWLKRRDDPAVGECRTRGGEPQGRVHASVVHVRVRAEDDGLRLSVRDDGVGGATAQGGSGLIGLRDRVEALGGTMSVSSPPGQGTILLAALPIEVR